MSEESTPPEPLEPQSTASSPDPGAADPPVGVAPEAADAGAAGPPPGPAADQITPDAAAGENAPDAPAVVGSVPVATSAADAVAFAPPGFEPGDSAGSASMEMLDDVQLDVRVELGRTNMVIEDVLKLGVGSVVTLDKLAGDPVDVYINDRMIARGEVLVLNENFCVRINAIQSPVPDEEPA